MIGLFVLIVGLVVLATSLASGIDGRALGPLGIFLTRWVVLFGMYLGSPIPYDDVAGVTWVIVLASVGATILGYAAVRGSSVHGNRWPAVIDHDDAARADVVEEMSRLIKFVAIVGSLLFVVYYLNIASSYGPFGAITRPQRLRLAISEGATPLGFHFLYFFEFLPALIVARRFIRRTKLLPHEWFLILFCISTLLTTTARTNPLKAILWVLIVVIFNSRPRKFEFKRAAGIVAAGVVAIALFSFIGGARGVRLENTQLASVQGEVPAWFEPLAIPYHYLAGPLPAFDELVTADPEPLQWGQLSLNPAFKVAETAVPVYDAPTHIQPFVEIPYDFNVYTHLDVMYRDFGIVGPPLISLLLGIGAGLTVRRWATSPWNAGLMLGATWWALVLNASTGSAAFGKLSYVVQGALILWLIRRCRKVDRTVETVADPAPATAPTE